MEDEIHSPKGEIYTELLKSSYIHIWAPILLLLLTNYWWWCTHPLTYWAWVEENSGSPNSRPKPSVPGCSLLLQRAYLNYSFTQNAVHLSYWVLIKFLLEVLFLSLPSAERKQQLSDAKMFCVWVCILCRICALWHFKSFWQEIVNCAET